MNDESRHIIFAIKTTPGRVLEELSGGGGGGFCVAEEPEWLVIRGFRLLRCRGLGARVANEPGVVAVAEKPEVLLMSWGLLWSSRGC